MIVKDLIEILKTMPQDAETFHLWDGHPRTEIQHVWLSREGLVVTADCQEVVYSDCDRPASAPTCADNPYWQTPRMPQKPATTPDLPPTPPHA